MAGYLGTVVDAAIGWLVQSILGSFFTGQMEAWTCEVGLAEDVEKLKFEIRNVEMVLAAAEGRRIDNKPLAQSLEDLRELLYDSEDIMDELDYYRLQQQIEGKCRNSPSGANPEGTDVSSSTPSYAFAFVSNATRQITSLASWGRKRKREEEGLAHSTMLTFELKHDISKRISGTVSHLCTIGNSVQRVLQLEISRPIAISSESQNIPRNARLTTSIPTLCKVYGRDAERDKIIEMLISGESSDLNVLPVVGIGGVGKTTLARFVYCDQRIRDHFDLQIWVCVSTNFDEVRLTREILEHVCEDRQEYENISNFNVLQEILLRNTRNKRFLLILDDMWEDKDRSGWTKLLAPLKSSQARGCMALATTRSTSVAKMIGTMDEVRLSGLDEKEFWLFFKACAFGNEKYEGDPSLQSIGKHIAMTLKGCPLAARSVGALLNTSISYKHWRTVQDKWKSLQEDADDILPILKLSYDHLPVHLQRCFSYCSLFPENHRFNGKKLVHAWISQNFVQCEDPILRLEETGQEYLERLVDLGFFQKVGKCYVMHDLMHELAGKVSSNECATIHGLKHETVRPSVRHLSIITTAFDNDKHGSFPSEKFDKILQKVRPLKKLRTLMIFGSSSINLSGSLCTLCKEARCLRLLRICVAGVDISSINSLLNPCHLRYLKCVYAHRNTVLPQAFTRFYHLQVLDVGISGNFVVPTDMNNLVNLRHLIAHQKVHRAIACVGNMTSLQELNFKVQNIGGFDIRQPQSMNELVVLEISQLENVKTKEEATGARLMDKEYVEKLSLSWEDSNMCLNPETAKEVLEGLQPHQNIKTLEITGYGGATSPTWLSSTSSVTSLQILPSFEMLPFLRKLTLTRMLNVMEISVPSLEELILINMPKLEKCIGSYGKELTSRLRVLKIKNCPQLNEFTLFQSYSSFDVEQKSWFPSLEKLSIRQCPHIIKWEILPLREMEALKELELMDLHVVRELSLPSLEKLVLIKMPSLEVCSGLTASPALQFSPSQGKRKEWLSSLHKFAICDSPCLIVSNPILSSTLLCQLHINGVSALQKLEIRRESFYIQSNELNVLDGKIVAFHVLRRITSLSIDNCPSLIYLPSEGFSQLSALKHLEIRNCTNLVSLSSEVFRHFNVLRTLYVVHCPNLLKSHTMSEAVKEYSMSAESLVLPSLKFLYIRSCGIAGSWLTQMLPHLQSLEDFRLGGVCPQIKFLSVSRAIETEGTSSLASTSAAVTSSGLDEQLLNMPSHILSSLKCIHIYSCPDLEFCGAERGFEGFISLKNLKIVDCPKLVSSFLSETRHDGTTDVGLLPPSIQVLRISHLPPNLQSYNPEGLPYLKTLRICVSPYLKCVQLHSFMALKKLQINRCGQLAVLEGLQFLSALRILEIEMNSELSCAWDLKLQEQEQGGNQIQLLPPSLEDLEIWNLTDRVQSRLLTSLPNITKLAVQSSPELTSLQLGCCTALKELQIIKCYSLASIEGFKFIRNLTSLKILTSHQKVGLPTWLKLEPHQQGASEIWSGLKTLSISDPSILSRSFCKQLTSLINLEFYSLRIEQRVGLVSLTDKQERSLQLLTSLQELRFRECPDLLSLPANLHKLTTLKVLSIFCCPSITRLPDMGPPMLRQLQLFSCSEELVMQCRTAAPKKLWVMTRDLYVKLMRECKHQMDIFGAVSLQKYFRDRRSKLLAHPLLAESNSSP